MGWWPRRWSAGVLTAAGQAWDLAVRRARLKRELQRAKLDRAEMLGALVDLATQAPVIRLRLLVPEDVVHRLADDLTA